MKRYDSLFIIFSLILIGFFFAGCKESVTDDNPKNIVFPDSNVSFEQHVQPLFHRQCNTSGCHDRGTHDLRGFDLESYQGFMSATVQRQIVFSGAPDNSPLIQRVEGTIGRRMPLNRTPLNQNQLKGLRSWVADSAKYN
ncbi:MAG: hypothetical protein KGZ58_02465 [Ignavibacteriales bacterium]|nr:hypothetical protein [Ignavibacteriales bacterium]